MCDKYSGMTVNERLYVSGNMTKFDLAIENKNIEEIKNILKGLELNSKEIKSILENYDLKKEK